MNHFLAISGDDQQGRLSKDDSHHALRVLRLQKGDSISISYGQGAVYEALIADENKSGLLFQITQLRRKQAAARLSLAVAPTKSNDRFEMILEKATELGVAEIWPIICHHSERKVYKLERGQRVIEAAFKQSHKGIMPKLHAALPFQDFLSGTLNFKNKYIAALSDHQPIKSLNNLDLKMNSLVMIGPEGDFSTEEIDHSIRHGFELLSLGKEVLRTETAAIMVAAIANLQAQSD